MTRNNEQIIDRIPQPAESHLSMLQSIIERMSSNSAACKTWCITLVSALVVVIFESKEYLLFSAILVPILLFFVLDAYYLGLEKRFRISHNHFIKKLHNESLRIEDLFAIRPSGGPAKAFFKAVSSFSIWPFYLTLFLLNLLLLFFLTC